MQKIVLAILIAMLTPLVSRADLAADIEDAKITISQMEELVATDSLAPEIQSAYEYLKKAINDYENTPKTYEAAKEKYISDLEDNAQKMRDKEQSMENKLLGAAGMGLTGAGLSQALSAGAEQQADEAAELDMAAYLATMHCNYAPGKNVQGGEKEVELPGGNELMTLKTEYIKLAADLKIRKEALGLQPGIESEEILDSATTGLYDDVALGKTDGAYTSLSRALTDENSEDAKEWTAQKEETAKDKKTGTTMAVVGAVGSALANIAINKNGAKESSEEIKSEYEETIRNIELHVDVANVDLSSFIAVNQARINHYNNTLKQHQDFIQTITDQSCQGALQEYINDIKSRPTVTNHFYDPKKLYIQYNLSVQKHTYDTCVSK